MIGVVGEALQDGAGLDAMLWVHKDAARASQLGDDVIQVGAGEAYEARCRRCYVRGTDVPST